MCEAVERYPDWWDSDLFGPPHREAEIYPHEVLYTLVDELQLARLRRAVSSSAPRAALSTRTPRRYSRRRSPPSAHPDSSTLALAHLLTNNEREVDFRLLHLLGPFHGVVGGRFREHARLTAGGRTLAAAILRARACGHRHSLV